MSLTQRTVAMMLPVTDVDRARTFYTGGSSLVLLPRPDSRPSESTAMGFDVDDITSEIGDLEGHGVVFEDYDLPELKTIDHVYVMGSEKAAWFKDPDGNVLCLHQQT